MGIELELEGFNSSAITRAREALHPLWLATSDGSLRNGGVEFVTNGGLGGERLHTAFTQMDELLARVNYDASFRCSTHMHINMLDFTFNQIARFMLTYACAEPVLFTFCGAHRRSSNFCVPVAESLPFHKKLISRLYDDAISTRQTGSSQVCNKYTAMNFLPLFDGGRDRPALGTVEFRGGRPLTTLAEFLQQANLLLSIKAYVRANSECTDDEFLTALTTHGVNNTVYSNGVNAGIETPQVELDDAMVTAWCLLKSYQSGKAAWANGAARRQRDAEALRAMGETMQAARPRGAGNSMEWGPNPIRSLSPECPNPYSLWTDTSLGFGPGFYNAGLQAPLTGHAPWTNDDLPFTRDQWPRLHEYLELAQRPDLSFPDMKEVIIMVLRDSRSVVMHSAIEALNAMLLYSMSETVTNRVTTKLVDFFVRCGLAKAQGISNTAITRSMIRPEITGTLQGYRYENTLLQSDWDAIQSCHLTTWLGDLGSVRQLPRGVKLWFRLLETKVRIKGRALLANTIEHRTGLVVALQPEMAAVNVIALLNAAGLRSEHHVHREDLPRYDEIAYIAQILDARGCTAPCVRPTTSRNQFALRTVPALNYAYGQLIDNMHAGRIARTSVTTGQEVY